MHITQLFLQYTPIIIGQSDNLGFGDCQLYTMTVNLPDLRGNQALGTYLRGAVHVLLTASEVNLNRVENLSLWVGREYILWLIFMAMVGI